MYVGMQDQNSSLVGVALDKYILSSFSEPQLRATDLVREAV